MPNMGERMPDIAAGRLQADDYARNFSDLHPPLTRHEAFVEADRCYFCFDAPCMQACPTHIDIPLFIREIQAGQSGRRRQDDPRVQHHGRHVRPRLPGGDALRGGLRPQPRRGQAGQDRRAAALRHRPSDGARRASLPPRRADGKARRRRRRRAGRTRLRASPRDARPRRRRSSTRGEKPGGLNEYGIAAYKTPNEFAQREVDFILAIGGITIENGKALGRDFSLADLKERFRRGVPRHGARRRERARRGGRGRQGLEDAVAWIAELRQASDLAALPVGRRVVVIGGGMTAIDAAVQSKLLGAEEVTIVYRRGQAGDEGEPLGAGAGADARREDHALGEAAAAPRRIARRRARDRARAHAPRRRQARRHRRDRHAPRRHGVQGDRPDFRARRRSTARRLRSSSRAGGSRSTRSAAPRCRASGPAAIAWRAART